MQIHFDNANNHKEEKMNKKSVSIIAVGANMALAALKIAAGLISRSSAVLAEGLHSAVDIISSVVSFFGIHSAARPADKEHPYGHHKFEVLSGLFITVILFLTGIYILYESYQSFVHPDLKEVNYFALGVMAFSTITNEIMARVKISVGKREHSIALISDGVHSRVDVIASLAVFAGLFLTPFFLYTDPLLTLLIGLYIIKESYSLGREAIDSLLDTSAGDEIDEKIREIAQEQQINLSDIKTQKRGSAITANLMITLSNSLNIEEASRISSEFQKKLGEEISNLDYVAIQIQSHDMENDYYQPKDKTSGIPLGTTCGWQRQGRSTKQLSAEPKRRGSSGVCVCIACGHETKHKRGVPCSQMQCSECGGRMTRK